MGKTLWVGAVMIATVTVGVTAWILTNNVTFKVVPWPPVFPWRI